MAVNLSSLGFVCLLLSVFVLYVSGTQQAFLSVKYPVVYIVTGKYLSLDCLINGASLSASQVSWKHEGKWLNSHTQRQGTKVQLLLRNVSRQDDGIYQCGVFNFSGLSLNDVVPKDVNVTVLVGGAVSKPMCVSNGLKPPKVSLIWNAIDDYRSVYPFTYKVFYCHKPSFNNKFCFMPPFGFNVNRDCIGSSINTSSGSGNTVVECNVTYLFKRLYPNLFDILAGGDVIPRITFSINIGNVQSDAYSKYSVCNPVALVKCTKPVNIRVNNLKSRTLSLTWDAPKDMGDYTKLLLYSIEYAADGTTHSNKSTVYIEDPDRVVNLSYDITGLHPYTMYHIYIACQINSAFKVHTLGQFIRISARTKEEAPSHYPTISENYTFSIDGEYRNVTLNWKLPDKKTWNGIITRIELRYWITNSTRSRNDASPVTLPGNVSMTTKTLNTVVVFSNVSMTTGTLTHLRLDETYAVEAVMCTRVGCGPPSPWIPITGLDSPDGTAQHRTKEQRYFNVIIGVTIGLLVCIACAVLTVYLWKKKRRRRRKQDENKLTITAAIGKLPPPQPYDSANGPSKIEESGDYDEIIEPLLGVEPGSPTSITSQGSTL